MWNDLAQLDGSGFKVDFIAQLGDDFNRLVVNIALPTNVEGYRDSMLLSVTNNSLKCIKIAQSMKPPHMSICSAVYWIAPGPIRQLPART